MRKSVVVLSALLVLVPGCKKEFPVQSRANQPPRTYLWLFPDSTIAEGVSKQRIRWWGEDPDGTVLGFLLAVDSSRSAVPVIPNPDTLRWVWTTHNDTLISFPLRDTSGDFTVFVRAVDNTLGLALPEQASIRFTPEPFWDRDGNGMLEPTDELLPTMLAAMDTDGANQKMPIRNQPPTIRFANDPFDPTRQLEQPDTTYTAATFAWVGSDFDGDETITEYTIVLNDTLNSSRFITLPASALGITIYVPRSRSDATSGEVDADVYTGNFLGRRLIRTLPGLKLDSLNTFFVRATDVAGEKSPFVQMPAPGRWWFVRKPRSRLLGIIDYISSDSTTARNFYRSTFAQVTVPSGSLGNYDELNVGRGISQTAKQNSASGIGNPEFGTLVPRFIDPAFIFTLFLYDYVFWYTDRFPSLPVAQFSLFSYKNTSFDGRRGRIFFSTTFGTNPDPRGLLRDFAPIDSVTSVTLSPTSMTPTLGSLTIPGGYQILPDSSDLTSVYPTLMFDMGQVHSVYMRPVYKKADGRYVCRMQEDARSPLEYTHLITTNELRSLSLSASGSISAVGSGGTILASSDLGISWAIQSSRVGSNLRAVDFIDANSGWAVGDSGTILSTDNAGSSWSDRSVVTVQNLISVDFLDQQNGLVVGTRGLAIRSSDGGASWNSLVSGTTLTLRSVRLIDLNTAIAVGDSVSILKTTDGGSTWRNRRPAGIPGAQLGRRLLSVYFSNSFLGFAVGEGGMYLKSTDGGETWTLQTSFTSGELRSLYFSDQATGWAVGWNITPFPGAGLMYRTLDGGVSWSQLFVGGTKHFLNAVAFRQDGVGIVVGGGGIILRAQNNGASTSDWSFQPKGPLNVGVIDGDKRFVFLGLPLHLLNGLNTVRDFLQHVFASEFGP